MEEGFHPASIRKILSVGKNKVTGKYKRNSDRRRGITSVTGRLSQSEVFRRWERDSFLQEERDSVSGRRNRGSPSEKDSVGGGGGWSLMNATRSGDNSIF